MDALDSEREDENMDGIIIFASVMIILVCAVWLVKQSVIGITWMIKHIMDDVYKDLDIDMGKKE